MTWIGGIFSKSSGDRSALRRDIGLMMAAACSEGRSPLAHNPWSVSSVLEDTDGRVLGQLAIPSGGRSLGQVYADSGQELVLMCDGRVYDSCAWRSGTARVDGTGGETGVRSMLDRLTELPGTLAQRLEGALLGVDGDYAVAVSDTGCTVVSRNSLGTKPLYFAENDAFSAFASNRKPLWRLGLGEVKSLRAGMLAVFEHGGVSVRRALPFEEAEVQVEDMAEAVERYRAVLQKAVRKRLGQLDHLGRLGVLLSGGVDSCLEAKLICDEASGSGFDVIAYTVGLAGSPDVAFAREFAEELGIEHRVRIMSVDEVEAYIPKVIDVIEDGDFVQVEAGMAVYAAMEMAAQDGINAVFSGQGPDEIWGGYSWYPRVLARDGRQELCRRMRDDFGKADVETLDRENKIAMAHGAEMLFPYLDTEVVDLAMSVSSELKVISEEDNLGKHPHRRLATLLGIPEKYADREKVAAQHGTGIHGALDEIARRNRFNEELVRSVGYQSDKITTEKMGSSSRYGYRYAETKLWKVPQHVQFFLHALAHEKGLLNRSVGDRVEPFLRSTKRGA